MPESDIDFLNCFLKELKEHYQTVQELSQSDVSPSENTSADEERCARLADEYGFEGNLFRNLFLNQSLSTIERTLRARIVTIPQIIIEIEKRQTSNQFSANELEILRHLRKSPFPQTQTAIDSGTEISRKTIGCSLAELRKKKLVERPNGIFIWRIPVEACG